MANSKKGIEFIISIEDSGTPGTYNPVACQRGGTLNRTAETIDTTCKSTDGWRSYLTSLKTWSIDGDGVLVIDDTAYQDLVSAFVAGTEVLVQFYDTAGNGWSGSAVVAEFPIEAPYDDTVTYSLTLQGTGALVETVIP